MCHSYRHLAHSFSQTSTTKNNMAGNKTSFELTIKKRSSAASSKGSSNRPSAFPLTIQLSSAKPTVLEVKKAIHAKSKKLSLERQRITTEDKRALTDDGKTLSEESVKSGDVLYVKDLGPQVAWRTVFLTEYFGPLFIHPLLYHYAPAIWRKKFEHSNMQRIALVLVLFHYLKREYETVFVHRFSNGTMPLFNIFKNSTHYWILSGVLLAGAVYTPYYSAAAVKNTVQDNPLFLAACTAGFLIGQLGTGWAHQVLRNLRPAGTRQRNIPRGGAFELVSCPNYFFETIAWTSFTILTLNPASALFAAVSVGQMAVWALKKHRNYRKEFKDYPRKRKAMFPFLL